MEVFNTPNFWFAFGLTAFAGLSTGIGSAIGLLAKRTNHTFLSAALGFSAGVMVYVSFVEILQKARDSIFPEYGEDTGAWIVAGIFFGAIILVGILDNLTPSEENPHEIHEVEELHISKAEQAKKKKLLRMGIFSAIAIAGHNFPEGLATFFAALQDSELGIALAIAIAIHNIPEGIAVSVPIYYATGSRKKAFWYSFMSGLAEPVGAFVGYLLLAPYLNDLVFGILFAAIAGIMVFISLDELLPTAQKYGKHHTALYGLIAGMMVMELSLRLF